ncbi:MAG: hypothetical protein R6W73_01925 [Candidatus Saliniplasma sp.]
MVLPIIAMLAVTMIVAGYWNEGEQIEIDVDEGYQELEVEYRENLVEETDLTDKYYENETATSVTTVNNESTLELNVEMFMSSITGEGNYQTKIWLSAEGKFSSDLDPDEIRLTAQGLGGKNTRKNRLDFLTSSNEGKNASFVGWDETEKISPGARGEHESFITFDVEEERFNIETMVQIGIDESNIGNEYSYQFQSVLGGLSEEVTSTVEVTFLKR